MTSPHDFDAFYVGSRRRLLLQTWALTGDLPASRRAVRDAYVAAWHRWRKVGRTEDPEQVVRPHAWASAQRRSTTRPWHRERGLSEEVRSTLDALQKLSPTRRRVLVLSHLASLSLPEVARELALLPSTVERELQSATAQLSLQRGVPSTSVRSLFEPLGAVVGDVTWPRVTIVRRAGATRRRVHVLAGAALTTAALVASGVVVTDDGGLRSSLQTERLAGTPAAGEGPATRAAGLDPRRMLARDQAARLAPDLRWRVRDTTDNTAGDGLVLPCQAERYADPEGEEALVRRLRGQEQGGGAGGPRTDLTQVQELSADADAARTAYRRTLRWFAGCSEPRVQLLATEEVVDVGEQATLFVLRSWDDPVTTHTVAVARTGRVVGTLVRSERTEEPPAREPLTALLAVSVNAVCGTDGAGLCAGPPSTRPRDPLPVGTPGMLEVLDLPPAGDLAQPWVGTDPQPATVNLAATRCDETDFAADPVTDDRTRTFVVPEAELPAEFGLTETVGLLPRAVGATAFVAGVRERMAGCESDDLGTEVEPLLDEGDAAGERAVWRVTVEVSEDRTVEYLMGVVRNGRAVGQVGFVPADGVGIDPGTFNDLVARAQVRLAATPGL